MFLPIALLYLASVDSSDGELTASSDVGSAEITNAVATFAQTCWRHVGKADELARAAAAAPIPFRNDIEKSAAYRQEWTAPNAKLIFSAGNSFPIPVCTLDIELTQAREHTALAASLAASLSLSGGREGKPPNGMETFWDSPAGADHVLRIVLDTRSDASAKHTIFTALLFKKGFIDRTQP